MDSAESGNSNTVVDPGLTAAPGARRTTVPLRLIPQSVAARDVHAALLLAGAADGSLPVQVMSESEERFRQLAESVNDVFWVYEPKDPRFLYVSPAYEREWSRSAEDLYGDAAAWLRAVHPDDRAFLQAAFSHLASGDGYAMEYRTVGPDGKVRWILEKAFQIASQSGQVSRIAGISQDVTERKAIDIELLNNSRRRDEFLAMLAHELRNPLEPIRSAAAVLARLHADGPSIEKKAVAVIERQVIHLTRLVDDLLDVARINHNKIRLRSEPTLLHDVIAAAVDNTRLLAEKNRLHVQVSPSTSTIWILGDVVRLTQVFTNLLHNAAKFSSAHGRIDVRVREDPRARQVTVTVRDQGAGIAPGFINDVFELFSQEHQAPGRDRGGLGIGLQVVRRMTELHGGTVTVQSAGLGRGSEFCVTLPTMRAPAATAATARAAGSSSGQRILLVDDNQDAAESTQVLLEMEGYEVTLAFSGKSALDLALRIAPDIVILDIGLPDMSGHEVARRIRDAGLTPIPLMIAITGYGREQDVQLSRECGFTHHLVKPADHAMLLAILAG